MDKIKYKKIENFLDKKEIDLFSKYSERLHRHYLSIINSSTNFEKENHTGIYAEPLFEILLELKKPIIEKITSLKLFSTYSYWRMYTYGADLPKHTDRPSCEISATVHLSGTSDNFPIYMDGEAIHTKPGDAIIYKGIELPHWRNELEDDFQCQVFLHYVDQNGLYKDYKYDKRKSIL